MPHTEALEVVGLLQAPDGNQRAQVYTLVSKAYDWSKTVSNSGSPCNLTWISLSCCIWRSIAYALPAMSLSDTDSSDIATALLRTTLPCMGIKQSFPKVMRYAPGTYLGLGIPNPRVENGISKLSLWTRHASSDTVLGKWFCISYEYLQLEINHPGCFFDLDYDRWSFLATNCWIKDLWKFVHHHKITLRGPPTGYLQLQRHPFPHKQT